MPAMGARTTGVATSTVPPEGAVRRSGGYVGTVVESTGPGNLPCMADPPTLPPAPRRIEWRLDDLDLEQIDEFLASPTPKPAAKKSDDEIDFESILASV